MAFVLVTVSTTLALNAQEHDPLVQGDVLEHYAYRALEAGIDKLLSTLNQEPYFVTCSSARTNKTCTNTASNSDGLKYDAWEPVDNPSSPTATEIPEYFVWNNPTLCFSQTKVADTKCASTSSSGNLEYARIRVIGAAGYKNHLDYQSSIVNFEPVNGFLIRVYWSNYNVSYPGLGGNNTSCHVGTSDYNWEGSNAYKTEPNCSPVYFINADHVVGPIFSNDSIFIAATATKKVQFETPTLVHVAPVTTADPNCQFVGYTAASTTKTWRTAATCSSATAAVAYTKTKSTHGESNYETIPATNSALAAQAATAGCLYSGPTTISFYEKKVGTSNVPRMHIWSPETPRSGTTDLDNYSTNPNKCFTSSTPTLTPTSTTVPVPSALNAGTTFLPDGVIYVETGTKSTGGLSGSCSGDHDNPFDGYVQSTSGAKTHAQIVSTPSYTGSGYNYTADVSTANPDCEGDAFIRDARAVTGETPGITGRVTVGAQNNLVITGSLKYLDCKKTTGGTWTSQHTCAYNAKAATVNDALGLIANNFIEVNHPVQPSCTAVTGGGRGTSVHYSCVTPFGSSGGTLRTLSNCKSTTSTLAAVLCDPYTSTTKGLTINAAILALSASFLVNNWQIRSANSPTTGSNTTGHLYIYGTIAQDYRGPVGTFSGTGLYSGFAKWYVFDSRLQYVSVPAYLTPSTQSWALSSSSVSLATTCPTPWPKPYLTTSSPQPTTPTPTTSSASCA